MQQACDCIRWLSFSPHKSYYKFHEKMRCLFLPASAPEINVYEKLIKYIKSKVITFDSKRSKKIINY